MKKMWNRKVSFIPIIIAALSTVTKGLIKKLEDLQIRGCVETSLVNYWDQPEYWEESWWLEETCCHSNSIENPSAFANVKNSNNNNNKQIKQAKKEEIQDQDWVGRHVILWELGKRMKFDHTTKWYMHKPESVPENEINKTPWDFEI